MSYIYGVKEWDYTYNLRRVTFYFSTPEKAEACVNDWKLRNSSVWDIPEIEELRMDISKEEW